MLRSKPRQELEGSNACVNSGQWSYAQIGWVPMSALPRNAQVAHKKMEAALPCVRHSLKALEFRSCSACQDEFLSRREAQSLVWEK